MIKKGIITGSVLIVVLLCIFTVYRYSQHILAWRVNPKISVDGIKLMMTETEVKSLLGEEEEYVQGFGGYKLVYQSKGITLTFLNDSATDFYQKVSEINVSNPAYQILGIKVGNKFENALDILHSQGLTKEREGYPGYWRQNMFITIDKTDSGEVNSITLGIKDRVSSSRTY